MRILQTKFYNAAGGYSGTGTPVSGKLPLAGGITGRALTQADLAKLSNLCTDIYCVASSRGTSEALKDAQRLAAFIEGVSARNPDYQVFSFKEPSERRNKLEVFCISKLGQEIPFAKLDLIFVAHEPRFEGTASAFGRDSTTFSGNKPDKLVDFLATVLSDVMNYKSTRGKPASQASERGAKIMDSASLICNKISSDSISSWSWDTIAISNSIAELGESAGAPVHTCSNGMGDSSIISINGLRHVLSSDLGGMMRALELKNIKIAEIRNGKMEHQVLLGRLAGEKTVFARDSAGKEYWFKSQDGNNFNLYLDDGSFHGAITLQRGKVSVCCKAGEKFEGDAGFGARDKEELQNAVFHLLDLMSNRYGPEQRQPGLMI